MDLDHERRLTEVEERSKSNQHRIDDVERKQNEFGDLVSSVKEIALREQHVENDVKEIQSDVKALTGRPGKKWDSVVDKAITVAVAALITYVFTKLGL